MSSPGGASVALAIKITADAKEANSNLESATSHVTKVGTSAKATSGVVNEATAKIEGAAGKMGASFKDAAADARASSTKINSALDTTAGHADKVATKGAQAGGALAGLGGLAGGSFGTAILTAGIAVQGLADAGDLLNVVTESSIVVKAKDAAVTLAKATADKIAAGAAKAWTVAQAALNAVMDANPILLVVLAIVALVAAFVLAYKHSETFRNIVNGAFSAVAAAAGAAVSFIKDHWKLLLAILTGPIGAAVILIAGHWSDIRAGAAAVISWVKDKWGDLKALLSTPFEQAKNAISTAFGAVTSIIQGVAGTVQSVIDKVNSLIAALQKLAGASGSAHKAGQFGGATGDTATGSSGRSAVLNVHFHNIVTDPQATGRAVEKAVRRYAVTQGAIL